MALQVMAPVLSGMGLAFFVLFIENAADVIVTYIPSTSGTRHTLQGWVETSTGL